MIADGVIADSTVSFRITWTKPGKGGAVKWNQNDQVVELHSVDLYPDLKYSKATGLATYFNYSSAEAIVRLLNQVNELIDKKLSESPGSSAAKDKENNNQEELSEPGKKENETGKGRDLSYTVTVYADKIKMMDAQEKSGTIEIKHRVSDNLLRKVGDTEIDNTGKIWAEVKMTGLLGSSRTFAVSEFDIDQAEGPVKKLNLLVQVLPSIQLNFTPGEGQIAPKSEQADYLKRFSNDDSRIGRLVTKLKGENLELKQKLIKHGIPLKSKDDKNKETSRN